MAGQGDGTLKRFFENLMENPEQHEQYVDDPEGFMDSWGLDGTQKALLRTNDIEQIKRAIDDEGEGPWPYLPFGGVHS